MSIGLFIDGAYLSNTGKGVIDFVKLREEIEAELKDTIDDGYFFDAPHDQSKSEKFYSFLTLPPPHGPGLRTKIYWLDKKKLFWPPHLGGKPVIHPDPPHSQYEQTTQKAVDVGLIYHMVRSYYNRKWKKLVLVAGDGDFHEPVQDLVESQNVDLYLVGTLKTISVKLRSYARTILEIDKEPLRSKLQRSNT
jgi:uncharacterized LabA/DUF88 family protein